MPTRSSSPRPTDHCRTTRRRSSRAVIVALLLFGAVGILRRADPSPPQAVEPSTASSWIAAAFPVGQAGFAHADSDR